MELPQCVFFKAYTHTPLRRALQRQQCCNVESASPCLGLPSSARRHIPRLGFRVHRRTNEVMAVAVAPVSLTRRPVGSCSPALTTAAALRPFV
jgi:hypothetical protein